MEQNIFWRTKLGDRLEESEGWFTSYSELSSQSPSLKVRLCVILSLFKDMKEKELHLEVVTACEILGLF